MTIQIYNTLTRAKEPLQTIEPGVVKMYVCGVTVYDQAHGEPEQGIGGGRRVCRRKAAPLEQRARDGRAQEAQTGGRGHAHEQRHAQGEPERLGQAAAVARRRLAGHGGKRGRGQRDAEDPQGEFHHPVRVVEIRDATRGQE